MDFYLTAGFGVLVLFIFLACSVTYTKLSSLAAAGTDKEVSVQILVLGDVGRSPRMQYHALSIARHGGRVDLIGYDESAPHPDLITNPKVKIHALSRLPKSFESLHLPFIIHGPLKVIWQFFTIQQALLWRTRRAQWLLVQNPPSIPTLLAGHLACRIRNTRFIIDWHNYGYSILAGTKGPEHILVKISREVEMFFGRRASDVNITVTHAMRRELGGRPWSIRTPILALHDRPAAIFQPVPSQKQRRRLLETLTKTKPYAQDIVDGKTRLLVSSTSWTPDEDFSLLLDALVLYAKNPTHRPVLVLITGHGPQKAMYQERIRCLDAEGRLANVSILTGWFTLEDYAGLLSCADLGVCLHRSSSGVDLPMKVVDMFGSGLPVAAYSAYESFGELVGEGVNGCGFETADELALILARLLGGDGGSRELGILGEGARKESTLRWDQEWDHVLAPVFGFGDQIAPRA